MKTLKSVIAAIIMLAGCGFAAVAESYSHIVIRTSFDSDVTLRISSDLTTTFDGSDMVFNSDYLHLSLPLQVVKGWSYRAKDDVSGIVSEAAADHITMTDTGDSITFGGLPENSKVIVSTVSGRLIISTAASGEYTLGLDDLANGIYIVVVNDRPFKIAVNR